MRVGGVVVIADGAGLPRGGHASARPRSPGGRAPAWPAPRCSARSSRSAGRRAPARPSPRCSSLASTTRGPAGRPRRRCSPWPTASGWACRSSSSRPGSTGPAAPRAGCAATSARIQRRRRASCSCSSGCSWSPGVWEDLNTLAADRARQRLPRCRCDRRPAPTVVQPRLGPRRLAALDLAPAHQHAHRAVPAAAARDRRRPRLDLPAARDRRRRAPRPGSPTTRPPGRCSTGSGFFEVYASPWFAAIYLLLFVSLIGCVLPRTKILWHQAALGTRRARPRRLDRLAAHREVDRRRRARGGARAAARGPARPPLPRARPRRRDAVGREGLPARDRQPGLPRRADRRARRRRLGPPARLEGRRHRAGGQDLRQHAVALRHLQPRAVGRRQRPRRPFTIKVDRLDAHVRDAGQEPRPVRGAARLRGVHDLHRRRRRAASRAASGSTTRSRPAAARCSCSATATPRSSPCATPTGTVLYSDATPFLPQDNNYTSVGVVKVPGASPKQLGFAGFFLPTGQHRRPRARTRSSPTRSTRSWRSPPSRATCSPAGSPQSVYSLDTASMTPVPGKDGADQLRILLQPGRDLRAARRPRLDHLRPGRAVRRPVDPHRPGQVAHPRGGAALARRPGRLARHPSSKGVRAGWSGARAGSYCGVRRRPGQGRRRRDARRDRQPS